MFWKKHATRTAHRAGNRSRPCTSSNRSVCIRIGREWQACSGVSVSLGCMLNRSQDDGRVSTLRKLREILPLKLVTGARPDEVPRAIGSDLRVLFDPLLDIVAGVLDREKPAIYLALCRSWAISPSELLVLETEPRVLRVAADCGMIAVHYLGRRTGLVSNDSRILAVNGFSDLTVEDPPSRLPV
jgi:hypothetical protein